MELSDKEYALYNRHIIMSEISIEGQKKLKAARVLIIGAGGLGCPVLQYLTAAGVGTIGIVDYDTVSVSNLQRQILFSINDVGKNKAICAKEKLQMLNPFTQIKAITKQLSPQNALKIIAQYDLVIDCTDNFSTRYLINDACVVLNKPLVYGAIYKFEGQVSVFNYNNGPSYRCLYPEPPLTDAVPNCSEIGVLGVLPGIIGCYQANEALKIILKIGDVLNGKLALLNLLTNQFLTVTIRRNEQEIAKIAAQKDNFENQDYTFLCETPGNIFFKDIDFNRLEILSKNKKTLIIDVRELWEQPKLKLTGVAEIPLSKLAETSNLNEVNKAETIITVCQSGKRSVEAIKLLQQYFSDKRYFNLKNGVEGINN